MKTKFYAFLAILFLTVAQPASAGPHYAQYVEIFLHTTTVSDTSYTTLFAAPYFDVKRISVFTTANNPIEISTGASGSETQQFVVSPGTLPGNPGAGFPGAPVGAYNPNMQFFPVSLPAGKRIAVRCLRSPCTTGYIQVNLFYNL